MPGILSHSARNTFLCALLLALSSPAFAWEDNASDQTVNQHIAVLLPLSGPAKQTGQAILTGILTSYYKDNTRLQSDAHPEIKTYDTNSTKDIVRLYKQAVYEGAQGVIGPLRKESVKKLFHHRRLPVPTIALNQVNYDLLPPANLFQFSLSPLLEVNQMTKRAASTGKVNALILAPDNPWGKSMARRFGGTWTSQGGLVVEARYYPNTQQLGPFIAKLLGIAPSQSRIKKLEALLDQPLDATPRRRQDIDLIFLAATPPRAQQILPLLHFYYAGDLPIYSLSLAYTGVSNPRRNKDIEGLAFCDMPWVLAPTAHSKQLKKTLSQFWPGEYGRAVRLYGLGVDALHLLELGEALKPKLSRGFGGVTGRLQMDAQQRISRHLTCATIKNGKPRVDRKATRATYS